MAITLNTISDTFHSIAVTDGGGSLTVDGTVELGATTLAALESITVQNGSGGAAVNIQDGGNSITVDGTVELGATTLSALESITVQNGSGGAAVNIQDGGNSITVDGSVTATFGAFATWQNSSTSVTTTATQLTATPLTGRDSIIIQNLGSNDIYVGPANTVTSSGATQGLEIPKGSSQEIALGATATLWAITSSGTSTIICTEYAF